MDLKGDFASSLPILEKILDITNGKILPLTEDSVNLVGITESGKKVFGEEQITKAKEKVIKITYDKDITVNPKVYDAVNKADLIIFSSGSLYTSIIPHLINKDLVKTINNSKAKKMYICNLFTQPGETDGFKVSDHIKVLENYLGNGSVNLVLANDKPMSSTLSKKYATSEQKDPVILDVDTLEISVIPEVPEQKGQDGKVTTEFVPASLKITYV